MGVGWQAVHECPDRASHDASVVGRLEQTIALLAAVADHGVEPVVGAASFRFGDELQVAATEVRGVLRGQLAFVGDENLKLLQLGAAQCRIQVGQAVVVADLVVDVFVWMGLLGGGGDVFGAGAQGLVGEDHAAPAGGDDLVAIEAQRAQEADGTGVASFVQAAE